MFHKNQLQRWSSADYCVTTMARQTISEQIGRCHDTCTIVCKFYTRRCVGSVRITNFSVASWQKTTCYNWDQIAILCWITLFEKDLRLHWSGICDFYLLNCNREQSYYKYCQCSQNFLWVKKMELVITTFGFRCTVHYLQPIQEVIICLLIWNCFYSF